MRMDPGQGESAADWLATAAAADIAGVLRRYGEEPDAARIARAICEERERQPLRTTGELAALVARVRRNPRTGPRSGHRPGRHPATQVFQAIRIFINRELEELAAALVQAVAVLRPGGRLAVISFHSLEDRLVKRFLRDHARVDPELAGLPDVPASARPSLRLCGRAIHPGEAETARNPRARSAVLRVAERLA
jgi:16S rRNA (cytosine1402-N4)-methyltransferase